MVACQLFAINIEAVGDDIKVANITDWQTSAFPSAKDYTVFKVSKNQVGDTEVDLTGGTLLGAPGSILKLRFKGFTNPEDAFWKVVLPQTTSEKDLAAFYDSVYDRIAQRTFGAAGLSHERAVQLAKYSHQKQQAFAIAVTEYKGKRYFIADLGPSAIRYNDAKLTDNQRIALVYKDRLLTAIKGFASQLLDTDGFFGVKVIIQVLHSNFVVPSDSSSGIDNLEIYVPLEAARQFADADITAQTLLKNSVLIVNGNRFNLDLSLS